MWAYIHLASCPSDRLFVPFDLDDVVVARNAPQLVCRIPMDGIVVAQPRVGGIRIAHIEAAIEDVDVASVLRWVHFADSTRSTRPRCHPPRTRPEFGSLMRLVVSTASNALPGTRRKVCNTSLFQRSSGAPDMYQGEPLSATMARLLQGLEDDLRIGGYPIRRSRRAG